MRLVSFSGIGIASGVGSSFTWGNDCVSPFDSLARMFCVSVAACGSGMVLTRVALMALPPEPVPPQDSPEKRPNMVKYPACF